MPHTKINDINCNDVELFIVTNKMIEKIPRLPWMHFRQLPSFFEIANFEVTEPHDVDGWSRQQNENDASLVKIYKMVNALKNPALLEQIKSQPHFLETTELRRQVIASLHTLVFNSIDDDQNKQCFCHQFDARLAKLTINLKDRQVFKLCKDLEYQFGDYVHDVENRVSRLNEMMNSGTATSVRNSNTTLNTTFNTATSGRLDSRATRYGDASNVHDTTTLDTNISSVTETTDDEIASVRISGNWDDWKTFLFFQNNKKDHKNRWSNVIYINMTNKKFKPIEWDLRFDFENPNDKININNENSNDDKKTREKSATSSGLSTHRRRSKYYIAYLRRRLQEKIIYDPNTAQVKQEFFESTVAKDFLSRMAKKLNWKSRDNSKSLPVQLPKDKLALHSTIGYIKASSFYETKIADKQLMNDLTTHPCNLTLAQSYDPFAKRSSDNDSIISGDVLMDEIGTIWRCHRMERFLAHLRVNNAAFRRCLLAGMSHSFRDIAQIWYFIRYLNGIQGTRIELSQFQSFCQNMVYKNEKFSQIDEKHNVKIEFKFEDAIKMFKLVKSASSMSMYSNSEEINFTELVQIVILWGNQQSLLKLKQLDKLLQIGSKNTKTKSKSKSKQIKQTENEDAVLIQRKRIENIEKWLKDCDLDNKFRYDPTQPNTSENDASNVVQLSPFLNDETQTFVTTQELKEKMLLHHVDKVVRHLNIRVLNHIQSNFIEYLFFSDNYFHLPKCQLILKELTSKYHMLSLKLINHYNSGEKTPRVSKFGYNMKKTFQKRKSLIDSGMHHSARALIDCGEWIDLCEFMKNTVLNEKQFSKYTLEDERDTNGYLIKHAGHIMTNDRWHSIEKYPPTRIDRMDCLSIFFCTQNHQFRQDVEYDELNSPELFAAILRFIATLFDIDNKPFLQIKYDLMEIGCLLMFDALEARLCKMPSKSKRLSTIFDLSEQDL